MAARGSRPLCLALALALYTGSLKAAPLARMGPKTRSEQLALPPLPTVTQPAPPRPGVRQTQQDDGSQSFLGRTPLPPRPHLPFMLQDFGTRQARDYFLSRIDAVAHADAAHSSGCAQQKMQLQLVAADGLPGRETAAHFVQTYQGVPIEGTFGFAVMGARDLRYARHFFVSCPGIVTQPVVPVAQAQAVALGFAHASAGQAQLTRDMEDPTRPVRESERVIIYVPAEAVSSGTKRPTSTPRLAWRVDVDTQRPWETRTLYVAADTGQVIATRKRSHDGTTGRVSFDIEPQCLGDAPVRLAMPHVDLGSVGTTDAAGDFGPTNPDAEVTVSLGSPFVHIVNHQGPKAGPWRFALVAEADNDVVIDAPAFDQIDPLYHVHRVRAWVRQNVPEPNMQTAWTDQSLDVHVNIDDVCNAYYDGSLHFFAAGDGCLNTGRVANLIYHEYAHGLHAHSTPDAAHIVADPQVGEGIADYVAATITSNPNMRGIYACDDNFRSCVNHVSFCEADTCDANAHAEPHLAGQALSGALWELRQALVGRYHGTAGIGVTDRFVLRFLSVVGDMHSAYQAAIAADDDDDADPSNGTTHSCEINKAFLDAPEGFKAHFVSQAGRVPCHTVTR